MISAAFNGFSTYSSISRCTASFAYSKSSKPVNKTSFVAGYFSLICPHSSSPSIYGIRISVITTSGCISSNISKAFSPLLACPVTENPRSFHFTFFAIIRVTSSSSSTSNNVYIRFSPNLLILYQFSKHK